MEKGFLSVLCAPDTYEELENVSEDESRGRSREVLVSTVSGTRFQMKKGIPVLLKDSRVSGETRKNRQFYDMIAPFYNILHEIQGIKKGGEGKLRQNILSSLKIGKGDKVLEVPIGTGSNLPYLPQDAEYFGVDISFPMLQQCARMIKKHDVNGKLVLGAAEYLPFKDNIFDCVFSISGFRLFSDKAKALQEMARVARHGAMILIADQKKTGVPLDLLPKRMSDVQVRDINEWELYCLTFRKQ
ncbi:methyltransferase domain-containing protein [Phosphitispora sp. TUW77]|uniref:methyltransferase domain-containing protein n=1 Tax=Phosphitispora sp. TUW77 TaxID=3152361 RepID=UPI003AB44A76